MSSVTLNKNIELAWKLAAQYRKGNKQSGWTATDIRALRSPRAARGQCIDRSEEFNRAFKKAVKAEGRKLRLYNRCQAHWFSVLRTKKGNEPVVIDFTFRQFDPKSPWPLIEPLSEYRNRIKQIIRY